MVLLAGATDAEGAPGKVEKALRSTLYLVFSSPEYQLG